MQELISLVEDHKWWKNGLRTNLSSDPEHFRVDKNGRRWLKYKYAPFSNTVKAGPILEHVQKTFPWANAVCLNRKSATSPPMAAHRDKGNKSASVIAFWGDYDNSDGQGALCLEDGTVYSEKEVWHGPYQGDKIMHWVTPHRTGTRYSCVVFRAPPRSYKKERPQGNELD